MNPRLLKLVRDSLQGGLVLAALFLLGRYTYFRWLEVSEVEIAFLFGPLVVAFLLLSAFYFGYSQSWQRMLAWISDGKLAIDRLTLYRVFFVSFVSRYLPAGSFLNLSGRVELLKRQGGRRKFGIQSLYYEQLYLIGAACFLAWLASLGGQVLWLPSWLAGFSIPGVAIGLAIFIVMLIGPEVILRFAGRLLPFIVTRARDVVIPRLTLAQRLELVARFLLVNIAQGGAAYFVLWSIYPRTPALPGLLLITTAAYPLSRVAGQLAPLVPGGIGVREGAFTFLLGPFLPVQPIILCAAIFRLISVVMELIIVALLSAFERLSPGADDSNYDAV